MDNRPLDEQRGDFATRRLIAMPVAGLIAWTIVGLGGYFLPVRQAAIVLFAADRNDRLSCHVHFPLYRREVPG
ncbi:MAG: hypothetical protein WDM77_03605 [Steroidobacteraceae bacterium]